MDLAPAAEILLPADLRSSACTCACMHVRGDHASAGAVFLHAYEH
jgi:hypothetical protein